MRPPSRRPESHAWPMSDGYTLHGRLWIAPARSPGVPVLYLHGIQSHGAWFEWSASVLADAGRPVLLPDRRGSGLNRPARGDAPSVARWLKDLDELAEFSQNSFESPEIDVLAVSWGGKLAVAWALSRPRRVRRLLLIAPGLFPAVDVGFSTRLAIVAALLATPGRQFAIPLNDPALFTETHSGQKFIAEDPHRLTHVTARFLYHSHRLDRRLRRAKPGSNAAGTTLWLAENDRIIRNEETSRFITRIGGMPPEIRVFAGASHTLEFEPNLQPIAEQLHEWAVI